MPTNDDKKQEALTFIQQLAAGDFFGASNRFDDALNQALPEAKLKETWQGLTGPGQVGALQNILKIQAVDRGENCLVTVTCQFEKAALDMFVVFNPTGKISGLNFQLASDVLPYSPPGYVSTEAFHDIDITVGDGEWSLPGSLSLPEGAGPFPAVVLVHGSGPQDRDEAIGPNKPFRDLAWGLASQGIAVLRYEKRTKAHSDRYTSEVLDRITVQDEVIDDALAAVRLLRQTPGIDPQRIYVLGHSLGATVAPRIGQQDPGIAGLIIMAGLTRPLEDTILDQLTYLANLSGEITEAQKADLEQMKEKVARVKDPDLSVEVSPGDLPLGIRPAYWLDLRSYHPDEVARTLNMRIFVLQGGRDYQVTAAGDFPAWQKALAGKDGATLKLYPKLYHLFISGEGPSRPQEYMTEGHVSEEVIRDIARWIKES